MAVNETNAQTIERLTQQLAEVMNRPELTMQDLAKMKPQEVADFQSRYPAEYAAALRRPGVKPADPEKRAKTPDGKLTRWGLAEMTPRQIADMNPADVAEAMART